MTPPTKPKPTDNLPRVYRGGSWDNNEPSWVRALSRNTYAVSNRDIGLGFRCAQRGCRQKGVTSP